MDKLIQICLKKVECKFNCGDPANYGDYQFEKLSESINERTGVSVSVQTLKRLYGRISYKGEYSPQPATKNALAQYVGYKDWDDLILKQKAPTKSKRKTNKRTPIILIGIVLLAALIFILLTKNTNQEITFSSSHNEGIAPHTSLFTYSFELPKKQKAWIDFGDWSFQELDNNSGNLSHLYLLPDLYKPTLYFGDKKAKQAKIYVRSTGWESGIIGPDHRPFNLYIPVQKNIQSINDMVLDKAFLSAKKLDTNDIFHYKLRNVKDFGISTDSITAKGTIMLNTSILQPTQYMSFRLIGDSSFFTVTFAPPGNFGEAFIETSDNKISGRNSDLKALEQDFSDWKSVAISIINDRAQIFINDSIIINNYKTTNPGPLKGISFSFMHGGYLRDFSLEVNGKNAYHHSFQP